MEYAIKAVHSTYWERDPVVKNPMIASAVYSQNEAARRIIHENLRRIRDSITANDLILK